MEGSRVRAAIRLRFRLQFLDHFHPLQVNHADCVVACVRCVELLQFRNIFHAFDAGCTRYYGDDFVCPQVDYIGLPGSKVSRYKVVIVFINGQVVESLSRRTWQIERGDFLQGPACRLRDSRCAKSQNESRHQKQTSLSNHATPRQCKKFISPTTSSVLLYPRSSSWPQHQPRYCRACYEDRFRNFPAEKYRESNNCDHNCGHVMNRTPGEHNHRPGNRSCGGRCYPSYKSI